LTKVPYVTFMKHAQKVTKTASKSRPILGAVIHREDYVAVTDSHRLYKAKDIYEGTEKQIDPTTGLEVDNGNYPDVERLIQDYSDATHVFNIDVTHAYEAVRAIEIASRVNKATTDMNLVVGFDHIELKTDVRAGLDVSYKAETSTSIVDLDTVILDIKYVKEAIHVLKDAKIEKFSLEYYGRTRPIQIRTDNFIALILPKRQI